MSKANSFIITETTASDMARAFLRFQFRQPFVIAMYALMLLFSIYIGTSFHSIWYAIAYAVLAFGLLPWSQYVRVRKRFKLAFPVGSAITAKLGDKELEITMPQATSKVAYTVFRSVTEQGNFLILRQKASKICIILPSAIFPDESLVHLKAKITAA